jgi:Glycosyl transferases group 1
MHILIASNNLIPAQTYGGIERMIWWLGKALTGLGHQVTYLVQKKSACPFAKVLIFNPKKPLDEQIPADCDLVHVHHGIAPTEAKPCVVSCHDNSLVPTTFHPNTVFASRDHAHRHGGQAYIYYGLDFDDYGKPDMERRRVYCHFLGNAARRVRNVRGAIDVASGAQIKLHVIGGSRVTLLSGLRITLDPNVRFHGMVGGEGKNVLLNGSKGLVFPLIWHDPFPLAITESLYMGCPLFGTPYGSLPELLGHKNGAPKPEQGHMEAYYSEWGCLSTKRSELVEALRHADDYSAQSCHDYAEAHFSALQMARQYAQLYEQVCNGHAIHPEAWTFTPADDAGKLLPFEQ